MASSTISISISLRSSCIPLRTWILRRQSSTPNADQNNNNHNHTHDVLHNSRMPQEMMEKKKGGNTGTQAPHRDHLEAHVSSSIRSLTEAGNGAEALGLLKVAFTRLNLLVAPKVAACHALMASLRPLDQILFVYKEMVKAGVLPDAEALNHLVRALADAGRIDSAVEQLKRMKRKGYSPNTLTFETVIHGLFRSEGGPRCVDDAVALLRWMLREGCRPDAGFFRSVTPLFCESGRLKEAEELFRRMRDNGIAPDSTVAGSFAHCLCENGRAGDAARVLGEIAGYMAPDDVSLVVDVVEGLCRAGEFGQALGLLAANSIHEVEAYNTLLEHLCEAGRLAPAMCVLETMAAMDIHNVFSWNIVTRGLCENGDTRKALEVIKRMMSSSLGSDAGTCSAVVLGFCKMRRYVSALNCFRRLCIANGWLLDATSYSELILGLCQEQMIEEAVEVFRWMSEGGGGVVPLDGDCLGLLIGGICKLGKVKEAIGLRSLAFSCGSHSNPDTFATIIHWLPPKSNKARNLLVFFSQMIVEGCVLDSRMYSLLIHSFCIESLTREVRLLFGKMVYNDVFPDPVLVELLVNHLSKSSLLHTIVDSLIRVAKRGGVLGPDAYNMIISTLLKEGHKLDACKFLDLMLERGWVPDVETHNLVVGLADRERIDQCAVTKDIDKDEVASILDEGLQ